MTEISRTALFGKLNPIAYRAIEGATVFCKLRGNPYVELVHWLHQILNAAGQRRPPPRAALPDRPLAAVGRPDRGAGQAPSRGHSNLRLCPADRRGDRARLAVCHPDVFSRAGPHRASAAGDGQDADLAQCALRDFPRVGTDRRRCAVRQLREHPRQLARGNDGRNRWRWRRHARRGERRDGARGHGQAGGAGEILRRPYPTRPRWARSTR